MPTLSYFILASACAISSVRAAPVSHGLTGPFSAPCHGRNVTYQGLLLDEVEGFVSIQYGQDTGGANRFKPPVPFHPPADSVVDAIAAGPACPQETQVSQGGFAAVFGPGDTPTTISEDCLTLNVWRPQGTREAANLPVLLFIFGGDLTSGFKDEVSYFPGELIQQSVLNGHPIIHVEINYRLGVFGFAQSQALEDQGSENAGVRDQHLAIEWVQQNIQHFGGDPLRITIHGQSSGGLSVGMQTLAYGAAKPFPFQQAIFESEVLDIGITSNYTRTSMAHVISTSKCQREDLDSASTLNCLRSLSMHDLLRAQNAHSDDIWLPVVDGPNGFLPEAPSTLMRKGKFAQVPAIIGWCENDASFFVPNLANATETAEFFASYLPGFTERNLERLLDLYPVSEFSPSYQPNGSVAFTAEGNRAARIYRDIIFVCQPLHFAQAIAERGNPVYIYDQNATLLETVLASDGLYGYGVFHSSEIFFVFGNLIELNDTLHIDYTPADVVLRNRESRSWSSFAAVGKPSLEGKETLQGWEVADLNNPNFGAYIIGGPNAGYAGSGGSKGAISSLEQEKLQDRCAFINSPEIIQELHY